MKQTEQSLLEQMRITDVDLVHRKELLNFSAEDAKLLAGFAPTMEEQVDALVASFYEHQTSIPEIALLIGDTDTLSRLRKAQRRYVLDLFSGSYDLEYVNYRLRIGLVHKRIGVGPKLYLAAIATLKGLLVAVVVAARPEEAAAQALVTALEKLLQFDITLVFETYIRSMMAEIAYAKEQSDLYAQTLEEKVRLRTRELEEMARIDTLTGLLNVRYLDEILTRTFRSAQRRLEPISVVFIDVNNFKNINDTHGHHRGDEILHGVGAAIKKVSRLEDCCFRYGGDEFCLVLPNCREEQAREVYITRLNAEIQQTMGEVTLSVGIVQTGPEEFEEPRTLVRLADERMYAAKKKFKGEISR